MKKFHKVWIIVLNYQSYEDTIKYVECLKKQKYIDLNILIVDNCSKNESYESLYNKYKSVNNIEVIKSERNGGYAYGNNFGLHYLKSNHFDYLIISNNDIIIEDSFLISKMIEEYSKLDLPAFVAPLMFVNGNLSVFSAWKMPSFCIDIIGSLRILEFLLGNKTIYEIKMDNTSMVVDCLPGSFFLSKKNVIYDLNLMDEKTFLYGEEVILAKKVKDMGLKNYLLKSLKYEHLTSKTISKYNSLFKMREYLIQSRIYYHQKYFGVSKIKTFFLKVLLHVWKLETLFVLLYKKLK